MQPSSSPVVRCLIAVAIAATFVFTQRASAQDAPSGAESGEPSEASAPGVETPDAHNFAEGQQQIVVRGAEAPYGPCPPAIPFACEMAVLEGSPGADVLFTIRLRTTEPWVMPPHSHPRAERVTVLSGEIGVGFGTEIDREQGELFTTGDYYVNAPGAIHHVWADGPVEIQITGIGPWEVHPYVE